MNICVCGYYGMGNFGDELFLETLKQVFSDHNVFAWHGTLDEQEIDAVIVGGGDLITPYSLNKYYFPDALKEHPTWLYGVGIVNHYPEDTWPEQEVQKNRERMRTAASFCVRDSTSARIARRVGLHENVEVVPDIAFSYRQEGVYPIKKSRYSKIIGVCVHAYENYPLDTMADLLSDYSKKGYQLVFIPIVNQNNRFSDVLICTLLKEKVEEQIGVGSTLILQPEYNLELIHSWIHSVDFLLSSKLHPSVVSVIGGIPVFCLSDQGKVFSFMDRFGLGKYTANIDMPGEVLKNKIDDFLINGTEDVKKSIPLIQKTIVESDVRLQQLKAEIELYMNSR